MKLIEPTVLGVSASGAPLELVADGAPRSAALTAVTLSLTDDELAHLQDVITTLTGASEPLPQFSGIGDEPRQVWSPSDSPFPWQREAPAAPPAPRRYQTYHPFPYEGQLSPEEEERRNELVAEALAAGMLTDWVLERLAAAEAAAAAAVVAAIVEGDGSDGMPESGRVARSRELRMRSDSYYPEIAPEDEIDTTEDQEASQYEAGTNPRGRHPWEEIVPDDENGPPRGGSRDPAGLPRTRGRGTTGRRQEDDASLEGGGRLSAPHQTPSTPEHETQVHENAHVTPAAPPSDDTSAWDRAVPYSSHDNTSTNERHIAGAGQSPGPAPGTGPQPHYGPEEGQGWTPFVRTRGGGTRFVGLGPVDPSREGAVWSHRHDRTQPGVGGNDRVGVHHPLDPSAVDARGFTTRRGHFRGETLGPTRDRSGHAHGLRITTPDPAPRTPDPIAGGGGRWSASTSGMSRTTSRSVSGVSTRGTAVLGKLLSALAAAASRSGG